MSELIRLPQDVGPPANGDTRGVPDLSQMRQGVADYSAMRSRVDDHETRALGSWGLVARWPDSRKIVESLLVSDRLDDVEDAAGILCRVGVPSSLLTQVLAAIEALPDSSARDALVEALPARHPRRAPESKPIGEALKPLAQVPLQGAWEPYTSRIQFIQAPYNDVVKNFSDWMRNIQSGYQISRHEGSLGSLLELLDPYWWPVKRLLAETRSGWTAVFSNGHDTYEATVLSERLRTRGVVADFSPDVVARADVQNYGATSFELIERGRSVRTVHVSRQSSGWDFQLLGSEQPFEETQRYEARVKRERFDVEMLNRYCAALGIMRSEDGFYGPHAVLHVEKSTGGTHPHYATAAAWRADHFRTS